jgi:chemotaxis protein histidine kinase CheA
MVPPLAELDPERCYLAWEMVLAAPVERDAVRDVFIFVEDGCELTIEPVAGLEAGESSETEEEAAEEHDRAAKTLKEPRSTSGGRRPYDKPEAATSLRVPAAKLDQFVDLVGELVTVQARLRDHLLHLDRLADSPGWEGHSEENFKSILASQVKRHTMVSQTRTHMAVAGGELSQDHSRPAIELF